jgi:hypothetical protein
MSKLPEFIRVKGTTYRLAEEDKKGKDPSSVAGPEPGFEEEKAPSGELKDWEKGQGEMQETVDKDFEKEVEKSMKELGDSGDASTPQYIPDKETADIVTRKEAGSDDAPKILRFEGQLYKLAAKKDEKGAKLFNPSDAAKLDAVGTELKKIAKRFKKESHAVLLRDLQRQLKKFKPVVDKAETKKAKK